MPKITLFAIDDSNEYLDSLEQIFIPYGAEYELVGTHSDVIDKDGIEEMLDNLDRLNPDIVLMDCSFVIQNRPDDFGITLTKTILKKRSSQRVIMLASDSLDPNSKQLDKIKRAFRAGATAYLRKSVPHTWFEGMRETMEDQMFVDKEIRKTLLKDFKNKNKFNLKERELEVIHYLSGDKTSKEIAKLMNISYDGVNFHIGNIKIKLNAKTLQGIVALAFRNGLI